MNMSLEIWMNPCPFVCAGVHVIAYLHDIHAIGFITLVENM